MLSSQMLDINRHQVIAGAEQPFIGALTMLHRTGSQDTLHIKVRGVA